MSEHLQAAHHAQEATAAVAKATPPVAVTGMYIAGYSLADWLVLLTLIYTTLQIVVLLHKLYIQHLHKCDSPHTKGNSNGNSKQQ